jgi:hypothetical protein
MMDYKTDGAVVVVSRIFMVMEHRHEGGQQEKQYEKRGKVFMPIHRTPFTPAHRLIPIWQFVKKVD